MFQPPFLAGLPLRGLLRDGGTVVTRTNWGFSWDLWSFASMGIFLYLKNKVFCGPYKRLYFL